MLQLKRGADRVFNNLYFGRNNHIFLPLNRVIFLIEDTVFAFMARLSPAGIVQNQFIGERPGCALGSKITRKDVEHVPQ